MTSKFPRNNPRDVTPDDFNNFEDVPTYGEAGSTSHIRAGEPSSIYERTGKAAPTEVFPSSAMQSTESLATDESTVTVDRQPLEVMPAEPVYAEEPVVVEEPARRGTIDLGLLLLRLVLGGYLIFHAIQTFFRLGASDGITGLENDFSGYAYGEVLAIVVPTLELAAGVFIVLGLIGPVAAMVAVAVTAFMSAHAVASSGAGANMLMWDAAVWLPVLLFGISLAHQFTGPGFYAVDSGRSWARRPLASSWIFAVLGIAAAALLWWFGTGINPFA
ncbi:DoxX family protein [Corynebacterium qintianiae]|uniref:DoxX family protein n=1 Tax=Corynebacterium qintianiae TaxID=2709392 RepID=UPI0013ECB68C|nr:DoxX family protein [Corynebacterium qintianiae]